MEKPAINLWANFLANEKLTPGSVDPKWTPKLLDLCKRLAEIARPKIAMHKEKLESRALVVNIAMDMGIDLPAIKRRGKVAMGRGLLDAWNQQYARRFGSNKGTSGEAEVVRRTIVTKLSKEGNP